MRMVVAAYRDLWRRRCSPCARSSICALLILLAVQGGGGPCPMANVDAARSSANSWVSCMGAVQSFLLTPFMIAVHRFIILDEVTSGYALDPSRPNVHAVLQMAGRSLCHRLAGVLGVRFIDGARMCPLRAQVFRALVILAAAAFISSVVADPVSGDRGELARRTGCKCLVRYQRSCRENLHDLCTGLLAVPADCARHHVDAWSRKRTSPDPVAIASLFVSAIMHAVTLTL